MRRLEALFAARRMNAPGSRREEMPARLAAVTGRDAAAVLQQRLERETGVEPRKAASVAKLATGRFCCYKNTAKMDDGGLRGEKRCSLVLCAFSKAPR